MKLKCVKNSESLAMKSVLSFKWFLTVQKLASFGLCHGCHVQLHKGMGYN